MTIGEEIKRLRRGKGLSLTELGSLTDLTQGYISHIENGLKTPTTETACRIFEALGTSKLYALKQLDLLDETDILTLIDENERLKSALRNIALHRVNHFPTRDKMVESMFNTAKQALEGGSNDDRRNL